MAGEAKRKGNKEERIQIAKMRDILLPPKKTSTYKRHPINKKIDKDKDVFDGKKKSRTYW